VFEDKLSGSGLRVFRVSRFRHCLKEKNYKKKAWGSEVSAYGNTKKNGLKKRKLRLLLAFI
jgi:hypothetical protein